MKGKHKFKLEKFLKSDQEMAKRMMNRFQKYKNEAWLIVINQKFENRFGIYFNYHKFLQVDLGPQNTYGGFNVALH